MKFKKMLKRQREFSNLFFDAGQFDDAKREEYGREDNQKAQGKCTDVCARGGRLSCIRLR